MQEPNIITLSPALLQQFNRVKVIGKFLDDQAAFKACFEAFEREYNQRDQTSAIPSNQRYMSHPGLSPDDYDT